MDVRDRMTQEQRDALWKWRWLGWRGSTPAFKLSIVLAVAAVLWIASAYVRA